MSLRGGLLRAWALALLVAIAVTACSGDDSGRAAQPSGDGGAAYESLDEVVDAVGCKGFMDVGTGGNAGLEEFGVCNVGSANIDIYLTSQRGLWEHLADQFPSVLGPNWIIVSPSGVEGARVVRDRLGGELRLPAGPTPSSG
jgi:hypothetical protein